MDPSTRTFPALTTFSARSVEIFSVQGIEVFSVRGIEIYSAPNPPGNGLYRTREEIPSTLREALRPLAALRVGTI